MDGGDILEAVFDIGSELIPDQNRRRRRSRTSTILWLLAIAAMIGGLIYVLTL